MEKVLKLDNFEGPLDLLLYLIERKKIKISEIKIFQIIDEYLEYLENEHNQNISVKVEFLEIASDLLEIKTMSILNNEEEQVMEKTLKRKLEDYKIFKEIAQTISEIECEQNISYSRNEGQKITKNIPREYDVTNLRLQDMLESFMNCLPEEPEILEIEFEKRYSLKSEMDRIEIILYSAKKTVEEFFAKAENRTHLVYIFLAILDLYREGKIHINENSELESVRGENNGET